MQLRVVIAVTRVDPEVTLLLSGQVWGRMRREAIDLLRVGWWDAGARSGEPASVGPSTVLLLWRSRAPFSLLSQYHRGMEPLRRR